MTKELSLIAVPAVDEATYRALLDTFEQETGIHVHFQPVSWDKERSEFTSIALQRQRGDVAIVGAPVTADLVGMNALRPLRPMEINQLGGAAEFLPSRWRTGSRMDDPTVWAVPWLVDYRVLYYWKDQLAVAGIDESSAFTTPAQIEQTIQTLHSCGHKLPWATPIHRYNILHLVSSFVRAYGGELFSANGRKVEFHEPKAVEGIRAYMRLLRFVPQEITMQVNEEQQFIHKQAAVTVGGGWVFKDAPPDGLGCVTIPGASYLGGTDVVIWAHTRFDDAAFELVRFLTSPAVQLETARQYGMLPPRLRALNQLAASDSPVISAQARAGLTGRTFPPVPMIGLVEDRLSTALLQMQNTLLSNPDANLETLLKSLIIPLGNRLNISLNG